MYVIRWATLIPLTGLQSHISLAYGREQTVYSMFCTFGMAWVVFGPKVQTKQYLLQCMITVNALMIASNISFMIFENNSSAPIWPTLVFFSPIPMFWSPILLTPAVLSFKKDKIQYNSYHISLITIVFLITSQLIRPFATFDNWILHLYTYLASIEISTVYSTKEFRRHCTIDPSYTMIQFKRINKDYRDYMGIVHT